MQELSGKPREDITGAASKIENGIFEKEPSEKPTPAPLDAVIIKLTHDLYSELQKFTKDDDTTELKIALRSCIDILEDLHKRLE